MKLRHATFSIEPVERRTHLSSTLYASSQQYLFAGYQPNAIASADFNNDGHPDLAVCAFTSTGSVVSVLLGDGSGGFFAPTSYSVDSQPTSITVADFNGDGFSDIAVACSDRISVLLADGKGGFAPQIDFAPALGTPISIAAGDFNGDGKMDLAASFSYMPDISTYLGNGAGGFTVHASYNVGNPCTNLITADLNGDGRLDIGALVQRGGEVNYLLGDGTGGLSTFGVINLGSSTAFSVSLVAADFNGDGKVDLAASNHPNNQTGQSVAVALNFGQMNFSSVAYYPTVATPSGLTIGDLNGDGKPDLAVALYGNNTVESFLNNGKGMFTASQNPSVVGQNLSSIIAVDFNNDGKADLAVCSNLYAITVLINDGGNSFAIPPSIAAGSEPFRMATGDFNNDGNTDLAYTNFGGSVVSIDLGNANGGFASPVNYPVASNAFFVTTGDFNSDGKLDLAISCFGGQIVILLGNGDGSFATPVAYTAGGSPQQIVCADFNLDGKIDLAVANQTTANISVLLGNGAGAFSAP